MEPNAILYADPLDLLFENRNKSYGAYPLRKFYAQRLFISMGITLFMVGLCSFIYLHFHVSPIFTRVINIPDTHISPVTYPLPEKQILPPAKPAAPRQLTTSPYNTPIITTDQNVPDPMATVDELQKNAIGLKTSPGEGDNDGPNSNGNAGSGILKLRRQQSLYLMLK
jgi:protein TonB